MSNAHTPGPWHVNELNVAQKVDPYYIFIEPGVAVIERKVEGKNQHDMADARLIAAAPAMLEALEGLEALMRSPASLVRAKALQAHAEAVSAVIRAAKGEA